VIHNSTIGLKCLVWRESADFHELVAAVPDCIEAQTTKPDNVLPDGLRKLQKDDDAFLSHHQLEFLNGTT
jgi:hypothetical protein